jgi:hypothetical protein
MQMERTTQPSTLMQMIDAYAAARDGWHAQPATTEAERGLRAGEREAVWQILGAKALRSGMVG